MKTNFFADIAKNEGKTGKTGKTAEIVNKNNAISNLTHLTQPGKNRVRSHDKENTNTYSNLASVLPTLPNLPEKTDNSASSHVEFFDGGLSRQEAAATHHQATVPYRLNIGCRTQLVRLPEGLETAEVLQRAKAMYSGVEVSDQPPPQGWPSLADIPEMPKAGTPQPVEAWTPSGRKVFVTAYSAEHAAAIQRMNPPPTSAADDEGWVDVDDLEVRS